MIKKVFKPLARVLLNLKLRQKLLLSYLFLIIIPLGIYTLFSYSTVNKIMEEHIIFSATRAFDHASEFLLYKISKIIKVSDVIAIDNTLNRTLEKKLETYNLADQFKDMYDLRQYLDSFKDESDGIQVRLYVRDEVVYSRGDTNISSLSAVKNTKWYSVLMNSASSQIMCPSAYLENGGSGNEKVLSLARRLKESSDYSKTLAYLRIDFKEIDIRNILSDANTVSGCLTYLRNSEDITVSSTDDKLFEKFKVDSSQILKLTGVEDWSMIKANNEKTFVKVRNVPNTDWSIITVIPIKEIFSDISKLMEILFLLMTAIGTIAYMTAVYITYNITKRITKLIKRMKVVQSGSFENAAIITDSVDEIGELTQNYNYMIHRIITLMDEQYMSGQKLKNAELKALQAQINPHFLYNTLDMINWMSYEDKGAEIRSLVKSLSTFYKISLNMGRYVVPIKDELAHACLYVQIQNMRLNNKIHLTIDVDEMIKTQGIIKITLQPIIENSILHGIVAKPEKEGIIHIRGEIHDQSIILTVTDDGIGIQQDRISDILSCEFSGNKNHGFGIRNIHDRIRLHFGLEYGLAIQSECYKGTTVTVKLPLNSPIDE